MRPYLMKFWLIPWLAGLALVVTGCKDRSEAPPVDPHAGHHHGPGEHHDHAHDHAHDEHGTAPIGPESSGVPVDMSKGWCAGHGVPESVCTRCDESLVARFKAAGDWCSGHGLPESQCVQCNPEVKAKWAALNPKAGPAARPQSAGGPHGPDSAHPETVRRLLTGRTDPDCDIDQTQIRLADPSVVQKAGIEMEPATARQIAAYIEVPGEVEFDARKLVRVTPRVRGVVVRADVDLGSMVQAGDVLAVIESPELGEAKSRYLELRENLDLTRADFERADAIHAGARRLIAAVTATAPASSREALAEIIVGEAKGRLLNAHAELLLARSAYERASRLKEQGASSAQAYEAAVGALRKAEADFQSTRESVVFESERARLAAEKALKIAQNALEVAGRRLHILGLSEEDIDRLGAEPHEALARYELRAPIGGQVIERRAVIGEAVDEQVALYTVADLSTMWLELSVPQRDAVLLSVGQPVTFHSNGLTGETFRGELVWIAAQVDDRTRTVRARAVLPNENGRIRAKMFGTARIALHGDGAVLSVPETAVQTDGTCQLVFVRRSEVLFEPRKVSLGAAANGYVEILAGLAPGEPVVTTGSFLMKTEILKSHIGAGCCEVDPGR